MNDPAYLLATFQSLKGPPRLRAMGKMEAGSYLLSHTLEGAVPSAQESLTSVFGMGNGWDLSAIATGQGGCERMVEGWTEVLARPTEVGVIFSCPRPTLHLAVRSVARFTRG